MIPANETPGTTTKKSARKVARAEKARSIPKVSYRVYEAAAALGIDEATLYKKLNAGELKARKIGRATLIEADELRAFLANLPTYAGTKAAA